MSLEQPEARNFAFIIFVDTVPGTEEGLYGRLGACAPQNSYAGT